MDDSLREFDFIKAEDTIFIRAEDVLKILGLKRIFSNEDILMLGKTFDKYCRESEK